MLNALLKAINDAGTIMEMSELLALAYDEFGAWKYDTDADGNELESRTRVYTRESLQEIADIYANGFNCANY
jgi:hypothetical protein